MIAKLKSLNISVYTVYSPPYTVVAIDIIHVAIYIVTLVDITHIVTVLKITIRSWSVIYSK